MSIRTIPLIANYLSQFDFKAFGSVIDSNNSSKLPSNVNPEVDVRVLEIKKCDAILDVLMCNHSSDTLMIPLEPVKYLLPVGPVIPELRSRPFPGTNEIKVFYSEGIQGFILKKHVWFADPIVDKTSQWIEISNSTDLEKRNYSSILKVNFRLEYPT